MNLTKPQKLIYDMEKFAGGSIAVICGCTLSPGAKEPSVLRKAVNEMYRLNDALRIRIIETDNGVQQTVSEYAEQDIKILHFSSKAELDSCAEKYAKIPLDFHGSLSEMAVVLLPDQYGILVKLHHIISDAWTLALIATQFNLLVNGETPSAYSYLDYIANEQTYLQSSRYEKDKAFFLEQFKKCDEVTYLSEKQSNTFTACRKTFVINFEKAKEITDYIHDHNTSAFTFFTTVFAVYINRVKMNAEKFYIGTAVLNRTGVKEKNTMGMFVNTVPMLIELENDKSFADNLSSIENTAFSIFRHQRFNYGDVLSTIRQEYNFGEKLYDVMLSYQNATVSGAESETTWYHSGAQSESLQIHIDDRDNEGIYKIHYDYLTDKFTDHDIEMLQQHLETLLFDAIRHDNKKIYELQLLIKEEQQKLLFDFNDTAVDYPRDKCVHQLFEEQVQKTPDKTAIFACDKTLTYTELNEQSNRIAHALIEKGISVGDIVAFALPRKSCLIATMLGILKSGAAYLPIDPDYPQERIQYMLSDSKAKLFITESNIVELFNHHNTNNPNIFVTSERFCYCIYTSGSTGNPKGALLTHENVINYVNNNNNNVIHRIIKDDYKRIVSVTTVGFDIFVTESLLPLANGLEILLANEEQAKYQEHLNALLEKYPADVLQTTPTKMKSLIADATNTSYLKNIKAIVLGGEMLDKTLVEKLSFYTNAKIFNIYGPTETTVWSTNTEVKNDVCLYEQFATTAQVADQKIAVISSKRTLTYAELERMVDEYCAKLQTIGVGKEDIVAVHLDRGYELIVFQLAVLKAGAVFLPVDKRYPTERIEYMCKDCNVFVLISDEIERIEDINLITLDAFIATNVTKSATTVINNDACYIIYTSGSTGQPKGCMLHGKGILNFCKNNNTLKTLHQYENNIFACVNSVSFDYFIAESLLPLLNGYTTVVLDDAESTNQELFLSAVKSNNINVLMTTPTRLKLFFDDKGDYPILKQLNCICTSGEVLPPELLEMIYSKSPNAQIYNPLGPSECTVWNVGGELDRDCGIDIHIGRPIANTQIYIVDQYMQPTPIGVTGELCIAGDGVGAGYLNRPELTAEKFVDNPFGEGKLYKTGDLAYWREDGNIVYVGRNDFQVKIRGLRIELGEIENALCGVGGISQAVVVVRKNNDGRQLICAFYTGTEMDAKEIRTQIGIKLPKYMLPHIFTHLDALPLTTSGKINRKALPEVDLYAIDTTVEYIVPQTKQEKALVSAIESVLKIEKVSILDNFFDLGGDSLKAIELIAKLEKQGYHTDTKTIFDYDTIKDLAEQLTIKEESEEVLDYTGDIPATPAQMRVYTSQSIQADSTTYNVPYVFKVKNLDSDKLQKAINALVDRHEILRTHFENKDGVIIQVIDDSATCMVEKLVSDDIVAFIRPFDLSKAPLIRVGYYENTVMIDMHHIITDGGSMPVFLRELNELYMGRTLDTEPMQYKRFAVQKQDYSESEKYWLSVYSDELPELTINTVFKRGQKQSFNGNAIYDTIDIELHHKIIAFCKENNLTPYVFYMAGFNILLSKFSGCEDIVVGMPISGREGNFLDTIGMFVNTIALRNKPVGAKFISEFLQEVKENSIAAIAHQDYPFGDLVKKLGLNTADRNPLFDVMFAYQSEQMTDVVFGDEKAELLPIPVTTSKYDFTFNIMPRDNDVVIMVEYCTDLYKEQTIQRFIDGYKQLLEQMLDNCKELKDISAILPSEQKKLLFDFNDTAADYPRDKCVHQLFEEQVERTPGNIALKLGDKKFTFAELNGLANGLAKQLRDQGIGRGDIIAIISKRSYHIVVAMLAIFKCGGTYLPIDYNYPKERIDTIVNDSGCKAVLTYGVDYTSDRAINILDEIIPFAENPESNSTVEDICGIIYTSGSTGTPKGTLLKHKGLVNYTYANDALYGGCTCVLGFAIYTFDAFFLDVISPILRGVTAVMATESEQFNQLDFERLLKENPGCNLFITPAKFKQFVDNRIDNDFYKNIHNICIGGEVFPQEFIGMFNEHTNVYNVYGPTECSMWMMECPVKSDDVTLGKPMANTQVYVLGKYNDLLPIGVTGELCIAGDGVGAGYLDRPELTAEKFIDNPFGEGKLYKTGDLAYWREDGNIVYVGRNDFQVKIRGLRIELGEIENDLCDVDGISQAVVVVRKNDEGRQLICAFYTGTEIDAKEIRAEIGQKLPKYMVPHIITYLNEMPLTTSGKINRKELPEIDLESLINETEYVVPENDQQKELCRLIEAVLGTSLVGITDDFFDLGGDSLKAIEFVSKAHNEGIYFNLQNVFDYPTVQKLCDCIENGDKQSFSFADIDFTEINRVLEKNTLENMTVPAKTDVGNILLAGATGYLGIHILADFLKHDNGMAYCLVRGKDKENSAQRLKELLLFYFDGTYADFNRVEVICADLQKDRFGLSDEEYKALFDKIDTVINCAASVKHYGSYKYFYEANVETAQRLIEFCNASNTKLIHTSTLSVSGNSFGDDFDGYISETEKHFYESSLYIGQPLDNVYARSKFEAEKAVFDAMADGLQANIMRMGNLTNRLSDGVFQKNHESNAFLKRVKAVLEMGMIPDYLMDQYVEFTAIDEAANAVMSIVRHFSTTQTVFHINSTKVVYLDRLLEHFNALGYSLKVVGGAEFTNALRQTAKQAGMEHIFETFINDMDENDHLNYDSNIRIENTFTERYLNQLGFFWSEIGLEYLRKYVEYFERIGYWRKNE